MKRSLAFLFAFVMFTFGVAACGEDEPANDDSSSESTNEPSDEPTEEATEEPTEEATDEPTEETTEGGTSAAVTEYCDAVDAYVAKVKEVQADPAKAQELAQELMTEGQELAAKAAELTGITPEEAEIVADCTQKATDALTP